VVLATAHLNHNPADNRRRNLRALCQRCHLLHDRGHHRVQRWLTLRQRWAIADLFLGSYKEAARPQVEPAPLSPQAQGAGSSRSARRLT
jgi:hypothetical protein